MISLRKNCNMLEVYFYSVKSFKVMYYLVTSLMRWLTPTYVAYSFSRLSDARVESPSYGVRAIFLADVRYHVCNIGDLSQEENYLKRKLVVFCGFRFH